MWLVQDKSGGHKPSEIRHDIVPMVFWVVQNCSLQEMVQSRAGFKEQYQEGGGIVLGAQNSPHTIDVYGDYRIVLLHSLLSRYLHRASMGEATYRL